MKTMRGTESQEILHSFKVSFDNVTYEHLLKYTGSAKNMSRLKPHNDDPGGVQDLVPHLTFFSCSIKVCSLTNLTEASKFAQAQKSSRLHSGLLDGKMGVFRTKKNN